SFMYCDSGILRMSCSVNNFFSFVPAMSDPSGKSASILGRGLPPLCGSCQALLPDLEAQLPGQVAAAEFHLGGAALTCLPAPTEIGTHHVVNALDHRLAIGPLHEEHAFIPQHVGSVNLDETGQEVLQFGGVEGLLRAEYEGGDRVRVSVLVVVQEIRIDVEDGVEVEAADIEDFVDRGVAEVDRADRCPRVHPQQSGAQALTL